MAHRGMPDHGRWWQLGQRVLAGAAILALAVGLYTLLSLLIHGSVPW